MKKIFLSLLVILISLPSFLNSQELDATVTVNTLSQQAMITDKKVFTTLENSINEFLNSQRWTDIDYAPTERIKCNIQITIEKELGNNRFGASINVQSTRPVYGTDYETALFTFSDNFFNFTYEEFQPIQKVENTFRDNLSSTLSFYAYLIIGLDADSFEKEGGDKYLKVAQSIRNAAPINNAKSFPGWVSSDRRKQNRYNLIEEIMGARFSDVREAMYIYHRKGLDIMSQELEIGRSNMVQAIESIHYAARSATSLPILVLTFINSKSQEINATFEPAPVNQKRRVYDLITGMNPGSKSKFSQLR